MNGGDPVIGRVAYSKAGRDKGKYMVVVGIVDEDFLLVADGCLRPVEKPKKKRIKHLKYTDVVAEHIAEMLVQGKKILNADLQNVLSEYQKL